MLPTLGGSRRRYDTKPGGFYGEPGAPSGALLLLRALSGPAGAGITAPAGAPSRGIKGGVQQAAWTCSTAVLHVHAGGAGGLMLIALLRNVRT